MDFSTLIHDRYSVRNFSAKPVEQEKLNLILEAARVSPTACNNQPQRIYVLQSTEALNKIRQAIKYAFNAPLVLLICVNEEVCWKNSREPGYNSGEMDASIACTQMMLQAHALGLGTLWVRGYNTQDVISLFPLEPNERLVCILPIGYAAEDAKPSPMHSKREQIAHFVRYL